MPASERGLLPRGWSLNFDNGQYRATRINQKLVEGPGNEQRSEREGQHLGPPEIKAPLTQAGVSAEISNGNPIGVYRGKIVSWATGRPIVGNFRPWEAQRTAGNTKGSAGPSTTEVDRRPTGPPTPVLRNLDRGMRPAKDIQSVPSGNSNTWTWGVQKTIVTPLSALAENFIPRKISRKQSTPQAPTDNELDRSFAKTGSKKIETPQDSIESDIATIGAAYRTEIEKPVAMADVAGSSGPAVTGAGGPVVAGTQFLAVTDITGASGQWRFRTVTDVAEASGLAGAGGPVVTGTRFRAVTDVSGASGPAVTGASGPFVTGTGFQAVTEVAGASGPAGTGAGRSRNAVPGSRMPHSKKRRATYRGILEKLIRTRRSPKRRPVPTC